MADLKVLYESLGFKNVSTYIQSGNVIFKNDVFHEKEIAIKIKAKILEKYAFDVPIIIRTREEIKKILNKNPFLFEKEINPEKLHVTFLSEQATSENLENIKNINSEPDRFILIDKEIYIYCPNGYGNTKLNNTFFETKLKVTATTRNWRTVNELDEMFDN